MPVDSRLLHKAENGNLAVTMEEILCQEVTIEIDCEDDGISDIDLLDGLTAKQASGRNHVSASLHHCHRYV